MTLDDLTSFNKNVNIFRQRCLLLFWTDHFFKFFFFLFLFFFLIVCYPPFSELIHCHHELTSKEIFLHLSQILTGWSQPLAGTALRSLEQVSHTPCPQALQWWIGILSENSASQILHLLISLSGTQYSGLALSLIHSVK